MLTAARIRPLRSAWPFALSIVFAATTAEAQVPARLSLEEAITLARRNNPEFLTQQNDEIDADWSVREAYGAMLPSASVSSSMQYQAAGTQRFGVFTGEDLGVGSSTSYLLSNYSLDFSYRLDGETLLRPRQERANRAAVQSRIEAAAFQLTADVTRQYIAAVRARDAVVLTKQELERAAENLKLAEARVAVGAAIELEAKQAGVERGRAEVEVLRAENLLETETLRLLERLGIEADRPVELTSEFPVFEPTWRTEELVATALEAHPQLRAHRAAERASEAGVKMARSQYLPNLSLSLGWSGYTREATNGDFLIQQYRKGIESRQQECAFGNELAGRLNPPLPTQDCSTIVEDPAEEARILDRNNVFPFNFTREPFSAQLQLSLPIFNGLTRERRVEAARVAADDARHRLRGEELRLKTEVGTAHRNVQTAYRAVMLEGRNRELADEQLSLARERYRLGAVTFLDLMEAETLKARADRSYLVAVYTFHEGLAALEAAVGRKLDLPTEGRE